MNNLIKKKVVWFYPLFIILFLNLSQKLFAQVVINEYCCSNINVIADETGNYQDWIELYNTSSLPVDLTGYFLSDNQTNPTKWSFPSGVTIAANGKLLIMCSNNNNFGGTYYHTNFKLTQTKPEKIIFSSPSMTLLENITLNPTQINHSRGRTTDGAATWSLFTSPTPNGANSGGVSDYTAKPIFNIQAGFYSSSQNVTITCSTPGATIRYTTNGSEPTATSTLYTVPINISSTEVIRAKAFSTGLPNSFTNSNTYFINVTHVVPVVSVFGNDVETLLNGSIIDADAGFEFFDKSQVLRAEATGTTNKHGNDSWAYNQRGFDFVSKDQYGTDYALRWKLFTHKNRTEFQRVIVKALANDNYPFETGAHIRDPYVHTLSQRAHLHLDERTYEPCIVYVNGQYWGVYDLREKVDDGDFIDYYHNSPENSIQMLKTWGGTWSEYGGTQAQTDWNNLRSFILSNNMAITANYRYVDSLYSVKSLVDYFVLNSYVVCSDWLNWNTQWWRGINPNADKKKWRYCLWDEDATFGHYINYTGVPNTSPDADPCNPETLGDPGGEGHVPILNALMNNPEFYQYYVTRFADLANTSFRCDSMIYLLDSLVAQFQPEIAGQVSRWGGTIAAWQQNVQSLKDFINARCTQLSQGMIDCYNVTGPYPINFNVLPANSGTIEANSINIPNYPWTGSYYGNIQTLLKAHANPTYIFDYWEVTVDPVSPNINDDTVSTTFTSPQNVIAHFKLLEPPLTVIANTTNPLCPGDVIGSIQLTVTGGTISNGVYHYQWSTGATTQNLTNLSEGIYSVTVSDDDTCVVVVYDTIISPLPLTLSTTPDQLICNGQPVTLTQFVTGGTPIYHYFWNGNMGNPSQTYYPNTATDYICHVIDDNGCQGPTNTIHVSVSVPLQVDLIAQPVTICPGDTVNLMLNISQGGGPPYMIYNSMGNVLVPPIYVAPTTSGAQYLYVKDGCGSVAFDSVYITIHPLPNPLFSSDTVAGCQPLTITFNPTAAQSGETYLWNFGDASYNEISFQQNPVHEFSSAGIFDVSLTVTSVYGCNNTLVINDMINVYPHPFARFTENPSTASIIKPQVMFNNLSELATNYIWSFGDGDSSNIKNPMHWYSSIGSYTVVLIAISDKGCTDTATNIVNIRDEYTFYAPTAFSPDLDETSINSTNDMFYVLGNGIQSKNFHMFIFDRWGEIIYQTNNYDPENPQKYGWDGKAKGNAKVPVGTYTWLVKYYDGDNIEHERSGAVTVIR